MAKKSRELLQAEIDLLKSALRRDCTTALADRDYWRAQCAYYTDVSINLRDELDKTKAELAAIKDIICNGLPAEDKDCCCE